MRRLSPWLLVCGMLLAAAPALAYTIYLKDGTKIVSREKYQVDGDKAIIVLPSGTRTAYPLADIDVARTEEANQQDLGTAIVIEGGKAQDLTPSAAQRPKNDLQELIRKGGAAVQEPPPPVQTRAPVGSERRPARPAAERRAPLLDVQLANELKAYLISRGAAASDVFQGSTGRRILVVFETRAEGPVFKALAASAYALGHVRERFPDRVDALEIHCEVPEGGSGGRFTMTAEQAAALVAGRLELQHYYVEQVEF